MECRCASAGRSRADASSLKVSFILEKTNFADKISKIGVTHFCFPYQKFPFFISSKNLRKGSFADPDFWETHYVWRSLTAQRRDGRSGSRCGTKGVLNKKFELKNPFRFSAIWITRYFATHSWGCKARLEEISSHTIS